MSLYLIPRKVEPNKEGPLVGHSVKIPQVQQICLYSQGPQSSSSLTVIRRVACVSCNEGGNAAPFNPQADHWTCFSSNYKKFVRSPFSWCSLCGKIQMFLRQL